MKKHFLKIKNLIVSFGEIVKEYLLKYRFLNLILLGFLGIGLAYFYYNFFNDLPEKNRIYSGIFFIVLSLPVTFYLWFLRNHDKLEQLKKAEENNNFNNFSNALKLFTEKDNKDAIAIGLKLLIELRHKKLFVKQIDLVTQGRDLSKLNLRGANLRYADLRYANLWKTDLSNAYLRYAYLWKADLKNANLWKADLRKADLRRVDLRGTNLRYADLSNADLRKADLRNTYLSNAYLRNAILLISKEKDIKELMPEKEFYNFIRSNYKEIKDLRESNLKKVIIRKNTDDNYKLEEYNP